MEGDGGEVGERSWSKWEQENLFTGAESGLTREHWWEEE